MTKTKNVKSKSDGGIRIKSDADVRELLLGLWSDICESNDCHSLQISINGSVGEFESVINESSAFWSLTIRSLQTTSMLSLCRVFDSNSGTISLPNILLTLANHFDLFSEEKYKSRNKHNQFLDRLLAKRQPPSRQELEDDISLVSRNNPLVETLMLWRHNLIAHKSGNSMLNSFSVLKSKPISNADFKSLLNLAFDKLNKYSMLLNGEYLSPATNGEGDYLKTLILSKQRQDELKSIYEKSVEHLMYIHSGSAFEI